MQNRITSRQCSWSEVKSVEPIISKILDPFFWRDLEIAQQLLEPLYHAQKSSQADRSKIGLVVHRWRNLKLQWEQLQKSQPQLNWNDIFTAFDKRMSRQVTPTAWLAWSLDLECRTDTLDQKAEEVIMDTLEEVTRHLDQKDQHAILNEWFNFRLSRDTYSPEAKIWKRGFDTYNFWANMTMRGSLLAQIALRLHGCIANSVPSERAFSAMNVIATMSRNRLGADVLDKLIFIYMNTRVLARW